VRVMTVLLLAFGGLALGCNTILGNGAHQLGPSGGGGQGGSTNAGGAGGTPSAGAGQAGSTNAGGAGETGGATGTGGSAGNVDAGMDSAGGTGGGAAGTTAPSVNDLFGVKNQYGESLVDSFFLWPCYANSGQDCITIPPGASCPASQPNGTGLDYEEQGLVQNETFQVGGMAGKMYNATIEVNGISEGKYYENGTRAAGDGDPQNAQSDLGNNTWYTGGNALYTSGYNVYSIRVYDQNMKEVQHYYLNSYPRTGNVQYEAHWTFPISYKATFPVVGGGTIVYHASDINCHAVDNCGSAMTLAMCPTSQARVVPNEPGLTLPATYLGKQTSSLNYRTGSSQPWHSHIIHIKFTDVSPM